MDLELSELRALHGRDGQESNLHLLQDAGFLARKIDRPINENLPRVAETQSAPEMKNAPEASGLRREGVLQANSGYLVNLPALDEKSVSTSAIKHADPSWIKVSESNAGGLDCAAEVKGFAVKLFGFTLLSSLQYKKSGLCESRQMVDATCELADLKGRRLSSAGSSQERESAGESVLKSTKMCIDSMQAASSELWFARLDVQSKDAQKRLSSQDPQCSTSREGFVRKMLRCEV